MARSKKHLLDKPITGVTYSAKDKRILRVQLEGYYVVDCERHTVTDIIARTKHQVDKDDTERLARRAKRWLKPPKGSIPIK